METSQKIKLTWELVLEAAQAADKAQDCANSRDSWSPTEVFDCLRKINFLLSLLPQEYYTVKITREVLEASGPPHNIIYMSQDREFFLDLASSMQLVEANLSVLLRFLKKEANRERVA